MHVLCALNMYVAKTSGLTSQVFYLPGAQQVYEAFVNIITDLRVCRAVAYCRDIFPTLRLTPRNNVLPRVMKIPAL